MQIAIQVSGQIKLASVYMCSSVVLLQMGLETITIGKSSMSKALDKVEDYCQEKGWAYLGEAVPLEMDVGGEGIGPAYFSPGELKEARAAKNAGL